MKNIKEIARKFLLVNKIHKLPVSLDTLIKRNEWKVFTYGEASAFLQASGLQEYIESKLGFCYYNQEKQEYRIFVSDGLGYANRQMVIAHEIGHIVLRHTAVNGVLGKSLDDSLENEQEMESQIFALELLAPVPLLVKKKICTQQQIERRTMLNESDSRCVAEQVRAESIEHELKQRRIIQKLMLSALVVLLLCCGLYWASDVKQTQINDSVVVITKSGEKYHKPDCQYVVGKTVTEMTIKTAEENGKQPCKECKPTDNQRES